MHEIFYGDSGFSSACVCEMNWRSLKTGAMEARALRDDFVPYVPEWRALDSLDWSHPTDSRPAKRFGIPPREADRYCFDVETFLTGRFHKDGEIIQFRELPVGY